MAPTHRALGAAWWLAGCLTLNAAGPGLVNPVMALTGAAIAPVFAAGRASPDADMTWLSDLGHRQGTHRPRTAAWLTVATAVACGAAWLWLWLNGRGDLDPLLPVVWAPVTGWWSHLLGDAVFGRIPLGRRTGALALRVLGPSLVKRSGGRQAYWIGVGLDTDGLLERGNRMSRQRTPSGLHRVHNVLLGFHPTTALLRLATCLLAAAVVVQWVLAHPSPLGA